jgi:hypothetical protein
VAARGALPSSERAALNLAIALSLSHGAQAAAGSPAPKAIEHMVGGGSGMELVQERLGMPSDRDPRATAQSAPTNSPPNGPPSGPDDRNLGSGGPTGGTVPPTGDTMNPSDRGGAEGPGAQGSSAAGSSGSGQSGSGGESDSGGSGNGGANQNSGSGSGSNSTHQRSPAPIQ